MIIMLDNHGMVGMFSLQQLLGSSVINPTQPMKKHRMKAITWIPLGTFMVASAVRANDSFNAELSHFAGHTAFASVTTIVVDKYCPKVKRPALLGFMVSASGAFLGECIDRSKGGQLSWLDVAVGTAGAAVGSYATDKWYITPKVNTQKGDKTYGVMVGRRF